MRYTIDFGEVNAGGAPTFDVFKRLDTLANLTPPAIVEVGSGIYYFDYDWSIAPAQSVQVKVVLNGIELSDVISGTTSTGSGVASVGQNSVIGYKTAQYVVNQAALELALVQGPLASLTDPFASSDPNIQQLIGFVNFLGDDLNNKYNWPQFVKECTITTSGSALYYTLPSDFHEMFDQSGWNRSMRIPLIGPLTSQETQFLKARLGTVLINVAFRLLGGNTIYFPIPPQNGQTIIFEYLSSNWVQSAAAGSGPDQDSILQASDYVCYDPSMIIAGIKLLWSESHAMETSILQRRFDEKLAHAIERFTGARLVNLAGSGLGADRLLDTNNLPVTGYGGVS